MMKNLLAGNRVVPKRMALLLWAILLAPLAAVAEDNTTTSYISGTATNVNGAIIIGDTGVNNLLVISNATRVLSTTGMIGVATSANNNYALVSGPGTAWTNTWLLAIGSNGSVNRLVITNGARVVSGNNGNVQSLIGWRPTAGSNSVVVTGTGSVWTVRSTLRLGPGVGNELIISDGGRVDVIGAGISDVIIGDDGPPNPTVGKNRVVVTGSNSVLNAGLNASAFTHIGRASQLNQLVITNGGTVNSFIAIMGTINFDDGTNLVHVTGAGSLWNVRDELRIQRRMNQVRIDDGGTVVVSNRLSIGLGADQNNNLVTVDNGRLLVTNAAGTGQLLVLRGSNVFHGGTISTDYLAVSNSTVAGSSSIFVFNGGTLNTRGTTVSNNNTFIVGNGTSAATLNLQGGTHSFFNGLRINTNATLRGTGTVVGNTTVIGTLAPGDGPGILDVGNVTLVSNSTFEVELNGTILGSEYDQLDVAGSVNLSNSVLNILLGYTPTQGDTFTIINNDATDAIQGRFLGRPQESEFAAAGSAFKINYFGGTGNDVLLIVVPEPNSSALLGTGGLLLFWRRKRPAE